MHSQQKWWGDKWHKARARLLPTDLPARDQARVALQQAQRGAAWLSVNPSTSQGTELNNDEYRLALRFWLGVPLLSARWQGAACPQCGQSLDVLGDHVVCCSKNLLKHRHSVLQGALAELAQLAGIPVALEVALADGSVHGDVCFRQWDADGPLMVNLTGRHPTPVGSAPPPVDGLSAWFASQAEDKDSLYLEKCRRPALRRYPLGWPRTRGHAGDASPSKTGPGNKEGLGEDTLGPAILAKAVSGCVQAGGSTVDFIAASAGTALGGPALHNTNPMPSMASRQAEHPPMPITTCLDKPLVSVDTR